MTNVMVCSGLNHKNCQSWSRLVFNIFPFDMLHVIEMCIDSIFDLVVTNKIVYYHEMAPTTEAVAKEYHKECRVPSSVKPLLKTLEIC